jgi:hypothetical protein
VRGVATPQRRWFRAWAQSVLLLVTLAIAGCRLWGNDVVKVTLIAAASTQNHQLTDLSAIVGSDKYSWPSLAAGSDKNINLVPGPQDDRQLTFLYTFDGDKRSWDGPKFDLGVGYRIEITIDGTGQVSSRHCVLPCTL